MTADPRAAEGGPLGLLGGSFDPVHNGHLRIAIEAAEQLRLAEVRLIPLHTPGHRDADQAPADHRVAMLKSVCVAPLALDCLELERGGISYTVDTLRALRNTLPRRPLCLILGLDSYRGLPGWHQPEALLRLAHIVVAARPGMAAENPPGLDELVGNAHSQDVADLHNTSAGHVYFLDSPPLPIASSDLRARCRQGRSLRHLVPATVEAYIHKHHLYQT